ncbi:MAG: PIN domain-containing protein [Bacteroidaceae bacterium]|nr:PIN domain-containing protein [Bacteroidaceae bacterium]
MKNKQYILDTNTLIEFNAGTPSVLNHVLAVGAEKCCMSVVSLHELYYGAYYAKRIKKDYYEKEMRMINKLLEHFSVLDLPKNADEYAEIKNVLRETGLLIDEFDMIIAGQALTEGLIVITDNIKHFSRIPGLIVENWRER